VGRGAIGRLTEARRIGIGVWPLDTPNKLERTRK
jgi:hypothetical protein